MTNESSGLIYDARTADPQRRIAFFPSLCPLGDGSILAGFQAGPAKNAATSMIRLARSTDGGRSWAAIPFEFDMSFSGVPGSLGCAEMVEAEPGRLLLVTTWWDRSDPTRPFFDPVTEGVLHSRTLVAVSADGGTSWSGWKDLPMQGLRGCAFTGPILRWHDGTIAVSFESFREFDDPAPRHHAAWVVVSHDGGRTWPEAARLVVHVHDEQAAVSQRGAEIDFVGYWEDMGKWSFGHPVLRPLPDGRLLAVWYAGTPQCMSIHWARIRID